MARNGRAQEQGSGMELALVDLTEDSALVNSEGDEKNSTEALVRLLDSQRELFHAQIDHLRRIVLSQCSLTGINPLSQEMAAGALSIKIGKRPRDLLNPKAMKYMQSIFSVKDTIGKRETREISAICGATITQVREFFAGQRSRVRRFVRLSREKAMKLDDYKSINRNNIIFPSSADTISHHVPFNSLANNVGEERVEVQVKTDSGCSALEENKIAVNAGPNAMEPTSCSQYNETITDINSDDNVVLENIFNLMKKEETFSGQVKLMEWILQINDSAILYRFLTKGGIAILATWLTQATLEEQTSTILVIFNVLCHLPLHKALPVEISAILQAVNKLRFYVVSDISNKARFLLSRWSKVLVRSQNMKKTSAMSSYDAERDKLRKQRILDILSDESWRSKINIPDGILITCGDSVEKNRELEHKPTLKLLQASNENSSRKDKQAVSTKTKERRKVLMVEQPDCTSTVRSATVARYLSSNISRPISADDIQKAKMRAMFMQDRYGKDASANEKFLSKINDPKLLNCYLKTKKFASKSPCLADDEDKTDVLSTKESSQEIVDAKIIDNSNESSLDVLKCELILWQTPPGMKILHEWSVGTGANSKEIEVQTLRNQRENETFYLNDDDIPFDPKDPWDLEMDFDDSLTPEVPTEQPPEADDGHDPSYVGCKEVSPCPDKDIDISQGLGTATSVLPVNNGTHEPDLELLAVLLKNPELVFALTAGQGSGMNDTQTVALLDMLKNSGTGKIVVSNASSENCKKFTETVSLPSPTPLVEEVQEPLTCNQIPVMQTNIHTDGLLTTVSPFLTSPHVPSMLQGNVRHPHMPQNLAQSHEPKSTLSTPQMSANLNQSSLQISDISYVERESLFINRHNSARLYSPSVNLNEEAVISNKKYNCGPPSGVSFAHLVEAVNIGQVHDHNCPSFQTTRQMLIPQQPLVANSHLIEPHKRRSLRSPALSVAEDGRLEQVFEPSSTHQNCLTDASYRVQANDDRYNALSHNWFPVPPLSSKYDFDKESEFVNPSADTNSQEFRLVHSYSELGSSRLSSSGNQNHHSFGRKGWSQNDIHKP